MQVIKVSGLVGILANTWRARLFSRKETTFDSVGVLGTLILSDKSNNSWCRLFVWFDGYSVGGTLTSGREGKCAEGGVLKMRRFATERAKRLLFGSLLASRSPPSAFLCSSPPAAAAMDPAAGVVTVDTINPKVGYFVDLIGKDAFLSRFDHFIRRFRS